MTIAPVGIQHRPATVDDGWTRLAAAIAGWAVRHPRIATAVRRLRTTWIWLAPVVLLIAVIAVPQIREGIGVYFALGWVLVLWFWLCRTKTLSFGFVTGWFALAMTWSMAIAWLTTMLANGLSKVIGTTAVGGGPGADGAGIVIAGVCEESLKLLPLAVFAALATRRIARWTSTDFLLVGVVSGAAFQVCEELARRLYAHVARPGLMDLLTDSSGRGPASGYAQYSLSPLSGWSWQTDTGAWYAGHHVFTGVVAGSVGVGVAWWRSARGRTRIAQLAGRTAGLLLPLVAWWLVASVHAGYNAGTTLASNRWLDDDSPVPWLLRAGFRVSDRGRWLGAALLLFLLLCLYLDARRRRRYERPLGGDLDPGSITGSLPAALLWCVRGILDVVADLVALVRFAVGDVRRWATAHRRVGEEPLRLALARGRAAGAALRGFWGDSALDPATDTDRARAVRRTIAAAAVLVLLLAVFVLAPHWAKDVPDTWLGNWFAGLFDALADWWNDQPFAVQLLLIVGAAALITLSGGTFGAALWGVGIAAYIAGHGHAVAALIRDPRKAIADYLSHASPGSVALDALELALTLFPAGVGGRAGQLARRAMTPELERQIAARAAARAVRPVVFRSADPHVGALANQIERALPGRVVDVNNLVPMANGLKREIDIDLGNIVVQVKSGNARKLTGQLLKTAATTGRTTIGYAPDIGDAAWRNAAGQGVIIARNPTELIAIIKEIS